MTSSRHGTAGLSLLVLSLLGTACASFPKAPDEGGATWIRVQTERFSVATDLPRADAVELVRMLETWWAALSVEIDKIAGEGTLGSVETPEPLLVVAPRNRRELQGIHFYFGGMFSAGWLLPPIVSMGDIGDEQGREALRHELAHAVLGQHVPRVPRWFNEGLAEYLQTGELDAKAGTVRWGARTTEPPGGLGLSSTRALLDPRSWAGNEYAPVQFAAGLLVHMLVSKHPSEVACYLGHLRADTDPGRAVNACFSSRDKWDFELGAYRYSFSYKTVTLPFTGGRSDPRVSTMSPASVLATFALLDRMVLGGEEPGLGSARRNRMARNLQRALELDPDEPLAGLLLLADEGVAPARRAAVTAALTEAHPGNWRAWVRRAEDDDLPDADRRQAYENALRLAPDRVEVLRLAAFVAAGEERWTDARELGTKAWLAGASDSELRELLVAAKWRVSPADRARTASPPPPSPR